MSNTKDIDKYIRNLKEKITKLNLSEEELVMYVYLDLGYKLRFDEDFFFGGSKKKKLLYMYANKPDEFNRCFNNKLITCISASYMLEYILKKFGVDIITVEDTEDFRKYKHVYNIIKPKNNMEPYSIDLQDDIININYHAKTKSFGTDIYNDKRYIISLAKQKQMHKKLGYISKTNPYTDDYVYDLKLYLSLFNTFEEKIDFLLENIDPINNPNIHYWERRWHHERIINQLFTFNEIANHLHSVEIFKKDQKEKIFINGFFINSSNKTYIYLYSTKDNKYIKYSIKDFANKIIQENIKYRQNIFGINKELKLLKEKN